MEILIRGASSLHVFNGGTETGKNVRNDQIELVNLHECKCLSCLLSPLGAAKSHALKFS